MRKTKIVATLGPASNSRETIEALIDAGVDVVRQNFSHGSHEEHKEVLETVHDLSENVAVMMDTEGPDIRLRDVEADTVLEQDSTVEIVTDETTGTADRLSTQYDAFVDETDEGDHIVVADGDVELRVDEAHEERLVCTVLYGGEVISNQSLAIPERDVGPDGLTEKDREDLRFGAQAGFDLAAISFVKRPDDVEAVRDILDEEDSDMAVIAKVEDTQAVEHIDGIIEASDGIMVARGDLGVELPASNVPILQKQIIEKCNQAAKPVITATQMLKSMTEHPRATRAEVSDVSNAVMDGTDAVMLSEETAIGEYPVTAAEVMSRIITRAEDHIQDHVHHTVRTASKDIADVISKSVWQASREIDARYLIAHTTSGYTAQQIAKYRPDTDIIAFTGSETVQRQLNVVWGVNAYQIPISEGVDEMIHSSVSYLDEHELVDEEDLLVMTAGVPTATAGTTNMLEIRTANNILNGLDTGSTQ